MGAGCTRGRGRAVSDEDLIRRAATIDPRIKQVRGWRRGAQGCGTALFRFDARFLAIPGVQFLPPLYLRGFAFRSLLASRLSRANTPTVATADAFQTLTPATHPVAGGAAALPLPQVAIKSPGLRKALVLFIKSDKDNSGKRAAGASLVSAAKSWGPLARPPVDGLSLKERPARKLGVLLGTNVKESRNGGAKFSAVIVVTSRFAMTRGHARASSRVTACPPRTLAVSRSLLPFYQAS